MADSKIDFNALGQALDTSWGRSSTPKTASYSVKLSLLGHDRLLVSYAAIVNFGSERQMIEMKRAYESEANSVVGEVVKKVKSIYKGLTGSALTTKAVKDGQSDSLEIVSFNCHNAHRTAYFRRKTVFELS
jgi:hypothetical protein